MSRKARPPSDKELLQQANTKVEQLKAQLAEQEAKSKADIGSLKKDTEERVGRLEATRKELAGRLDNVKSTVKSEEQVLTHQLDISTRQFRREHRRAHHFEALYNKVVADQRVIRADKAATTVYHQALQTAQERQERALSILIVRREHKTKAARQLNDTISRVGSLLDSL